MNKTNKILKSRYTLPALLIIETLFMGISGRQGNMGMAITWLILVAFTLVIIWVINTPSSNNS